MHRTLWVFAACLLLQLCVCQTGCRHAVPVEWPDLQQLDELAERCEALCNQKDVAALRQMAESIKAAMITVALDSLPDGARHPTEVNALQSDLANLADSIQDPVQQDGAELVAILAKVHPIVGKLREAAGVPHVPAAGG